MTETPAPMVGSDAWIAAQPAAIAEQQDRATIASETVAATLAVLADAARDLAHAEDVERQELAELERMRAELAEWTAAAHQADQLATVHQLPGTWQEAAAAGRAADAEHLAADEATATEQAAAVDDAEQLAAALRRLGTDPAEATPADVDDARADVERRAATVAELEELARDTHPHRPEDAATLRRLGVAEDVAGRVLDYLTRLNDQDADECKRAGYWFARSGVFTVEQTTKARQWVRLVRLDALVPAERRRTESGSIVCWLELATGRLVQADGYRKRTGRVIADLSTEEGAARLLSR